MPTFEDFLLWLTAGVVILVAVSFLVQVIAPQSNGYDKR